MSDDFAEFSKELHKRITKKQVAKALEKGFSSRKTEKIKMSEGHRRWIEYIVRGK